MQSEFRIALAQTWQVIKPYWQSKAGLKGWLILLVVLVLTIFAASFQVSLAQVSGDILNALNEKNTAKFINRGLFYLGGQIALLILGIIASYLSEFLKNFWRKWMTESYLKQYFAQRAYYKLQQISNSIDNPDQRIQEDIDSLASLAITIIGSLAGSITGLIAASIALFNISQGLLIGILSYSLISTLISYLLFGRILKNLTFLQLKKEANFRFSLIKVKNYAESIAFYRGEKQEKEQINQRLEKVIINEKKLTLWQNGYQPSFQDLTERLPFFLTVLVLAPRVFSKQIKIGILQQSRENVFTVYQSFTTAFNQVTNLTALAASGERLYSLTQVLLPDFDISKEAVRTIDVSRNIDFKINNLTLQTPDYQRTLIKNLSLTLLPETKLLILGESGSGKSSLLRALAELWKSGTGSLHLPQDSTCLFLPQKPYLVGSSLKEELIYPNLNLELSTEELQAALSKVKLADLPERIGGFDQILNLSTILSLGEQQRVALARLFLHSPEYIFLDEATSALDEETQAYIYSQLFSSNSTMISVGHRSSLIKYHNKILRLRADQSWEIE